MSDLTPPERPRLQRNESPQSKRYQDALREYNRQLALIEATKAKEEQDKREAEKRAKRDVVKEVEKGITDADEANGVKKASERASGRSETDTTNQRRRLDDAIENAGG